MDDDYLPSAKDDDDESSDDEDEDEDEDQLREEVSDLLQDHPRTKRTMTRLCV